MANHPEWWDPYSCQPYKLPASEKPRHSGANLIEYLRILATTLAISPAVAWKYYQQQSRPGPPIHELAGLGVNPDPKWHTAHQELVHELGIRNLMVRIGVWELDELENLDRFLDLFPGYDLVINVLQSRDSVENPDQWEKQLDTIFRSLSDRCKTFQVGNAINRTKWGCRNSADALRLFEIADDIRTTYTEIKLLGSSVIDFEPLITLRSLFNFRKYRYQGCAAQLYVNRRGSPFGKQYNYFDLERKLRLVRSILEVSNNTDKELWITETNWPLLDTKPWTPNSGHPRSTVDEATQADYLTQYYSIAQQCGWVKRVYWWQLINPGYGLVDHRGKSLRKMPSFFAMRNLLRSGVQ